MRFLQNSYYEGRHAGLPLQNLTSFRIVGANLRVRPRFIVGANLRVRPRLIIEPACSPSSYCVFIHEFCKSLCSENVSFGIANTKQHC